MSRLKGSTSLNDLAQSDIVVEAITENPQIKKETYAAIDSIVKKDAIFASNTSLTGKIYFGDKSSRDFIVRLTVGGALVTGNSPLFEEVRIGGDTIVRGMEEGERTARGLIFDSLQFGVALERPWPGGSDALGFDLKNVYATLLFDHALITRHGSATPPPPGESRNFESVGASLEMALPGDKTAGSLEFGYAWSPQSIHDHGRVFTTVRFDF